MGIEETIKKLRDYSILKREQKPGYQNPWDHDKDKDNEANDDKSKPKE
jgi:hypothetical protein